jgi:hypothetical protein
VGKGAFCCEPYPPCRCHSDGVQHRGQLISHAAVYRWHPRRVEACRSATLTGKEGLTSAAKQKGLPCHEWRQAIARTKGAGVEKC